MNGVLDSSYHKFLDKHTVQYLNTVSLIEKQLIFCIFPFLVLLYWIDIILIYTLHLSIGIDQLYNLFQYNMAPAEITRLSVIYVCILGFILRRYK